MTDIRSCRTEPVIQAFTHPFEKDRMCNSDQYASGQIPGSIFNYVQLVSQSDGIGEIPGKKLGAEIAIIGAGCAGLCAAYELMKSWVET